MRNLLKHKEHGQVLVLFALMSTVIIGMVGLALDFAVIANQHRNLQNFADEAALAAAQQLNPTATAANLTAAQTAARQAAYVYLRANLTQSNGSALPFTSLSNCWKGGTGVYFKGNIVTCTLPVPYSGDTITICSPGEIQGTGIGCTTSPGQDLSTVSVRITETMNTSFLRLLGDSTVTAGGFGDAKFIEGQNAGSGRLPYSMYSNGCISTGNQPEIIGGDVYIN